MLTINDISDGQWATLESRQGHGMHGVMLAGSLDEHTVNQLQDLSRVVFDGEGFSDGDCFLIDLSGVTEIDHVGLAALVGIIVSLAANAAGVALVLPLDHPVRHALRVTGLDKVFDIHEPLDDANRVVVAVRKTPPAG